MKCPKCNKIIKKTDNSCRFCGEILKEEKVIERIVYQTVESKANKWLILSVGILSFLVLIETSFIIYYFLLYNHDKKIIEKEIVYVQKEEIPLKNYNTNEYFIFDNLEVMISDKYEFTILDNKYSPYNGKEVVVVPVIIKNLSSENHSLNLFDYTIYDPSNKEIDEVSAYFDESLYYATDLKQHESYTKYLYFLYKENGDYSIEFENQKDRIKVKFKIEKENDIEEN